MENTSEYKLSDKNALFYRTKIHKNCRKFFKRIYDCDTDIEEDFLSELTEYGKIVVNRFSETIPGSNDVFNIQDGKGIEISGVLGGSSLILVIPKNQPEMYEQFESKLEDYIKSKMN